MQIISGFLLLSVAMLSIQGGADAAALTRRGEKGDPDSWDSWDWSSWDGFKEDDGKDVGSKDNSKDDNVGSKDGNTASKDGNAGSKDGNAGSKDGNVGSKDGNTDEQDSNTGGKDGNSGSKDNTDDKDGERGKDATSSDKVGHTGSDASKDSSSSSPPSSPPSSTATYDGPTRKILCLHGGGGTAAGFQNEGPGAIQRTLGDNYELVYAQAPDGGLWMRDPPNGKGEPTTDPNWASESIGILNSIVQQQGPFYGILGYSQGSAFVPVFLSTVPDDTFQVALMFAGYVPTTHQGMVDKINSAAPFNNIPAMVWMGGQDSIITNDMTRDQAAKFTTPTILRSANNGHVVPTNSDPTFDQVISFINDPSAPLPPTSAPSSGIDGGKGDGAAVATGKGSWEQQDDGSWINTETGETYGAKDGKDIDSKDEGKDTKVTTTAKPTTVKPTALLCVNNDQWLKRRSNPKRARNCDWVAKKPSKRCKFKGKDRTVAADACPMACGRC